MWCRMGMSYGYVIAVLAVIVYQNGMYIYITNLPKDMNVIYIYIEQFNVVHHDVLLTDTQTRLYV